MALTALTRLTGVRRPISRSGWPPCWPASLSLTSKPRNRSSFLRSQGIALGRRQHDRADLYHFGIELSVRADDFNGHGQIDHQRSFLWTVTPSTAGSIVVVVTNPDGGMSKPYTVSVTALVPTPTPSPIAGTSPDCTRITPGTGSITAGDGSLCALALDDDFAQQHLGWHRTRLGDGDQDRDGRKRCERDTGARHRQRVSTLCRRRCGKLVADRRRRSVRGRPDHNADADADADTDTDADADADADTDADTYTTPTPTPAPTGDPTTWPLVQVGSITCRRVRSCRSVRAETRRQTLAEIRSTWRWRGAGVQSERERRRRVAVSRRKNLLNVAEVSIGAVNGTIDGLNIAGVLQDLPIRAKAASAGWASTALAGCS